MCKDVWLNSIEKAAWQEKWCRTCLQPDQAMKRITGKGPECPLLIRAAQNKLPMQWTRRRNATMGDTYRCDDYIKKPPVNRRATTPTETEPMLDAEPASRNLIPVDGWPDYRALAHKAKNGDHQ